MISEPLVKEFERRFLEISFQDKAGTHKNPELKNLQPTLGFAPNQRTPLQQAKQRTDNRQGTIDQDAEFIAFLESETQPITKPPALETLNADKDGEKKEVKTTPLIEDLRERKANKAKAAAAKAEKAEKDKKAQAAKGAAKEGGTATTEKESGKARKVEQAAKDAAKVLNKQAAAKQQQQTVSKTASPAKAKKVMQSPKQQPAAPASVQAPPAPKSANPAPQRERVPPAQRQRGNTDGIKKMLQKDLGIKPRAAPSASSSAASASTPAVASPTSPVAAATAGTKNTVPVSPNPSAKSPPPSAESKSPPVKAYLKHANPSQGMSEILIQQALAQYGEVANVTIDPRKGTAIAVFREPEALKKALEAKRVPVANGAVEVLEFRDRAATGSSQRGGFRGGRGGRGGAQAAAAASTVAATGGSTAATPS